MYTAKNFERLIGTAGFSETLLRNHFTLYQGYVTNTNKLIDMTKALLADGKTGPEYAELQRRLGWEWNGMRLHEYYFENLGGEGRLADGALKTAIDAQYGSTDAFKTAFLAAGAMRGIGWVVLYQDPAAGMLNITWINEHDVGHLAGAKPVLVMDVFEHAFLTDYGIKRADYLAAFWNGIDWKAAQARLS